MRTKLFLLSAMLMANMLAQAQNYDLVKVHTDGRLFLYKAKGDTLWLKLRGENIVAEATKALPSLSLNVGFVYEKSQISVQGSPADSDMVWEYSIDGGARLPYIWEKSISAGTHTITGYFVTPGYSQGSVSKTIVMPVVVSTPMPDIPAVPGKNAEAPSVPIPQLPATKGLVLSGVLHANMDSTIRLTDGIDLVYRDQPGSTKFKYTPRPVLKAPTTTTDLQLDKFPDAQLTPLDEVWYWSYIGDTNPAKLLKKGFTMLDSRQVKNTPEWRNIAYTDRGKMTMTNDFEQGNKGRDAWLTTGRLGTAKELELVVDALDSDGLYNQFEPQIAAQWHLMDWEFAYNYANFAYVINAWKQRSKTSILPWRSKDRKWYAYNFDEELLASPIASQIDAYNRIGYYHLAENTGSINASTTDIQAKDRAKAKKQEDFWNYFQIVGKAEAMALTHPGIPIVDTWMSTYEDALGGPMPDYSVLKIREDLSTNGMLLQILCSRIHSEQMGGSAIWETIGTGEPLNSEQWGLLGVQRLSYHNFIRGGKYTYARPDYSTDGGKTWLKQADLKGNLNYSPLNWHQERAGKTVKEPLIITLENDGYVTAYALNPYQDAPAKQTLMIRTASGFTDYLTIYGDRELTQVVAVK